MKTSLSRYLQENRTKGKNWELHNWNEQVNMKDCSPCCESYLDANFQVIVDLKKLEETHEIDGMTIDDFLNAFCGNTEDLKDASVSINDVKIEHEKARNMHITDGMKIFIHSERF